MKSWITAQLGPGNMVEVIGTMIKLFSVINWTVWKHAECSFTHSCLVTPLCLCCIWAWLTAQLKGLISQWVSPPHVTSNWDNLNYKHSLFHAFTLTLSVPQLNPCRNESLCFDYCTVMIVSIYCSAFLASHDCNTPCSVTVLLVEYISAFPHQCYSLAYSFSKVYFIWMSVNLLYIIWRSSLPCVNQQDNACRKRLLYITFFQLSDWESLTLWH